MLDLDRIKGTLANSVSAPVGTAVGAIGSGLLVQYLPAPTRLVYLVLCGIFIVQGIGVVLMRETATPRAGARASLRPILGLPNEMRKPFLLAAPAFDRHVGARGLLRIARAYGRAELDRAQLIRSWRFGPVRIRHCGGRVGRSVPQYGSAVGDVRG